MQNSLLKYKAITVGGYIDQGVIASSHNEVRRFGVDASFSEKLVKRLCPQLLIIWEMQTASK